MFSAWRAFAFDWLVGFEASLTSGGLLQDQSAAGSGDEISHLGAPTLVADPPAWSWTAHIYSKTGRATAGVVGRGLVLFPRAKSGTASAGLAGRGVLQFPPAVVAKSGYATVGGVGAGVSSGTGIRRGSTGRGTIGVLRRRLNPNEKLLRRESGGVAVDAVIAYVGGGALTDPDPDTFFARWSDYLLWPWQANTVLPWNPGDNALMMGRTGTAARMFYAERRQARTGTIEPVWVGSGVSLNTIDGEIVWNNNTVTAIWQPSHAYVGNAQIVANGYLWRRVFPQTMAAAVSGRPSRTGRS